jgi:hypothetical protein
MVGSSSAGLIGLLFVVITLTSQRDSATAEIGSRTFVTPTVFHFGVILLISTVAVMPEVSLGTMALAIAGAALVGLIFAGVIIARMVRRTVAVPHWSDYVFYGILPAAAYLGMLCSAAGLWSGASFALHGIAVAALALLLIGIRDAWDLATWLAYHRDS